MNNRFLNKYKMFSRIGSFWYQQLTEDSKNQSRSMVYASDWNRGEAWLEKTQNWLLGASKLTDEYTSFSIKGSDIIVLGPDINERIVNTLGTPYGKFKIITKPTPPTLNAKDHIQLVTESFGDIVTEGNDYVLVPVQDDPDIVVDFEDTLIKYAVRKPNNQNPKVLITAGRTLVLGIDYELSDSFMVFREHPKELFKSDIVHVKVSETSMRSPMCFPMKVDVTGDVSYIARYLRQRQDSKSFELAIAQAAGMVILPKASVLLDIRATGQVTRYIFEDFTVDVPYYHIPLVKGRLYEAGRIVGDTVKIYAPTGGDRWYRNLDWQDGLSLDGLIPFKGLSVRNEVTYTVPRRSYGVAVYEFSYRDPVIDVGAYIEDSDGNKGRIIYKTESQWVVEHYHKPFANGETLYKSSRDSKPGEVPVSPSLGDQAVVRDRLSTLFDKVHIQLPVESAQGGVSYYQQTEVEKFHEWVRNVEIASVVKFQDGFTVSNTSPFLCDIVGVNQRDSVVTINPFELLFESLLKYNTLVIDLKTRTSGDIYHEKAISFIRDNKPVGSTTIIRNI